MFNFTDESKNENLLNVYYAGFDSNGLPFSESKKKILKTLKEQSIYLKALALIVDKIIIPPSFYFYFIHLIKINSAEKGLNTIKDLYQAGILVSAMYQNMNSTCDFIEHKRQTGTEEDKFFIKISSIELENLFKEMPLFHRDTKIQSQGFSEKLVSNIYSQKDFSYFDEEIIKNIQFHNDINILNREIIFNLLEKNNHKINKSKYRKIYYYTNKAYYKQGALTYDAIISLVNAERYSIFQLDLFEQNRNSILIGYDPTVIIEILSLFNINEVMIQEISIKDLLTIRNSKIYNKFKNEYYSFAITLQSLTSISREKLEKIRKDIIIKFSQNVNYNNKYDTHEQLVLSGLLGVTGFFVIPVVGALLGFIPNLLAKNDISISNYVTYKFDKHNDVFKKFIKEIKTQT